jgi:hypothetical protein
MVPAGFSGSGDYIMKALREIRMVLDGKEPSTVFRDEIPR